MAFVDYYKILGVKKDIPQADVQKAYRKRAKQFHPDLHPGDPKAKAKFQALNEAYDVIGDPEKRQKYDRFGERWKEAGMFDNAGGFGGGGQHYWNGNAGSPFEGFDFNGFASGDGFSDFFRNMFGNGGGGRSAGRSTMHQTADVDAAVNIDMYTALLGGEKYIRLEDGTTIKLKVASGTQNNTKVRLRGKGKNRTDGTRGDLIITYNIELPRNLSDNQKELLRRMRDDR